MNHVSPSPYIQSSLPPPPPPLQQPASNMQMLYYGLVIIGTTAIILAIYNLIIIKWCVHQHHLDHLSGQEFLEVTTVATRRTSEQVSRNLTVSSFKYKRESSVGKDDECAVCLSAFEDGEEVKKLPGCNHLFHAVCIDMWLFSHSDCPLCRARVNSVPMFHRHIPVVGRSLANSRENVMAANIHFLPIS
ncbi:RING-H2 finger protein ATL52-like [Mercurialis annua]|uniref:RING-H2 finger protein ATL52-like n=1 Tax=Mercurialis annua TaxID=3986 RepID=UPI00215F63EB|nr:RING-H2 finger protein ATL52-like [Mercurialis annua]